MRLYLFTTNFHRTLYLIFLRGRRTQQGHRSQGSLCLGSRTKYRRQRSLISIKDKKTSETLFGSKWDIDVSVSRTWLGKLPRLIFTSGTWVSKASALYQGEDQRPSEYLNLYEGKGWRDASIYKLIQGHKQIFSHQARPFSNLSVLMIKKDMSS